MTPEIRKEIELIRLIHPEAAEWLDENEERIDGSGNMGQENQLSGFFKWRETPQKFKFWCTINRELTKLKRGEPYEELREETAGIMTLSEESAKQLCGCLELTSEFFDEDNEEFILLKQNNPRLFSAYEELFTIAYGADEEIK